MMNVGDYLVVGEDGYLEKCEDRNSAFIIGVVKEVSHDTVTWSSKHGMEYTLVTAKLKPAEEVCEPKDRFDMLET